MTSPPTSESPVDGVSPSSTPDSAYVHDMGQPFDGRGKVFAPIGCLTDDGTFYPFGKHPGDGMPTQVYACLGYTPEPDPLPEGGWYSEHPVRPVALR